MLLVALLALAGACGDDDTTTTERRTDTTATTPTTATSETVVEDDAEDEPGEPVIELTWTTRLDQDGYGYVLVVEGVVGDDHAAYTMQVEPLLGTGGGDYADLLAGMAGLAVNGFAPPGEGVAITGAEIATDGRTEVRVVGDERWYRNPWLLDEAAFAMGDAEWVRVGDDEAAIADLVTAVLNERYDEALRDLLATVDRGAPVEAPPPAAGATEMDEILTPWIGLAGPEHPLGGEASVQGDAGEGNVTWTQPLTYEPDGTDGELRGEVRWSAGTAAPPTVPADDLVIDLPDLTSRLAG